MLTSFHLVSGMTRDDRQLYAASEGGLQILDLLSGRWQQPSTMEDGYPVDEGPAAAAYDPFERVVWLGTTTGGLHSYQVDFGRWRLEASPGLGPIVAILPLSEDRGEGVLVRTPTGWYLVERFSGAVRPLPPGQLPPEAAALEAPAHERLRLLEPAYAAAGATLTADRGGRTWPVTSFVAGDRPGVYWLGTAGDNLYRLDVRFLEAEPRPFGLLTSGSGALAVDAGWLWIGGDGRGPRRGPVRAGHDLQQWRQYEAGIVPAPSELVEDILVPADAVWFGGRGGLYRLDRRSDRWLQVAGVGGRLPVRRLAAVEGGLWAATDLGLVRVSADGAVEGTFFEGRAVHAVVAANGGIWGRHLGGHARCAVALRRAGLGRSSARGADERGSASPAEAHGRGALGDRGRRSRPADERRERLALPAGGSRPSRGPGAGRGGHRRPRARFDPHGGGTARAAAGVLTVRTRDGGGGLGPGVEFDRIRSLLERARASLPARVRVGPGDDAAVVEGTPLVVSTDLSVEDVHFRRDWLSLEEIGFRAVAAALSDLAAMAAEPVGVLVSVALPEADGAQAWDELASGVVSACAQARAPLVGGDLSASPGPLMLDVTVLGQASEPVLRSGAAPGDEIWVTGVLGGSAGAVRLWREGRRPPPELRRAYAEPAPRIAQARWLARRTDLHALIDISDGLQGDVAHLAAASGVKITVDLFRLTVHPLLPGLFGERVATELALTGGEDYELCLATPPGSVEEHADAFTREFGVDLTRVGTVGTGSGVYVRARPGEAGRRTRTGAFDHFAGDAGE